MGSRYWPYLAIAALILCSAFFAGAEMAISNVNKSRLKKDAESGGRKEKQSLYVVEHSSWIMPVIMIGGTLAVVAAASLAAAVAVSMEGGAVRVLYSALIVTLLVLIFGDIVPKILARNGSDAYVGFAALPLRILSVVLSPIIWPVSKLMDALYRRWGAGAGNAVTEEDLSAIIDTIESEGVMEEDRTELLQSALDFSETTAQEILTPRVDMVSVDIEDPYEEILETVMKSPYSRIPVYEGSVDHMIGILHVNRLLRQLTLGEPVDIRSMLLKPCFVHKTMKLPEIQNLLRSRKMHMAIVTDEYGGTMGILTMEDVLEELVGEIWDETDEIEKDFSENKDGTTEVEGDVSLSDFVEQFELEEEPDSEYVTVGGWAIEMVDGYPKVGDSFRYENLTITVSEMDDRRITGLRVAEGPRNSREND